MLALQNHWKELAQNNPQVGNVFQKCSADVSSLINKIMIPNSSMLESSLEWDEQNR